MSYRFRLSAVLCVSLVLLYASGLSADTINVPADHATIQAAIDAASDGDEVVVAPGTYYETINFNGKAITLRSSSDDPEDTIIDANGSGSVVTCENDETATTVLQGFTLTGGYNDSGGGLDNDASSPTVTNCIISGNTATGNGGGMFNLSSSSVVTNCIFINNTAGYDGGGMYNFFSYDVAIINCTFSDNTAEWGGGMFNYQSDPTVTNSILWGNSASINGDHIHSGTISNPIVTYSCIQDDYEGEGNIDSDPLFIDTHNDNLRLTAESPCIDVGNNAAIPAGIVTDLDGNTRIVDGVVDMGAYESAAVAVVNDECSDAIPVNMDEPYTGSTSGATGIDVSCAINDALDVWHSFTPNGPGEYTISLCGSTFDTTLAVLDQCDGIQIACNDDSDPAICDHERSSYLTAVSLQGDSTYLIRIAGYSLATGDYLLTITGPPVPVEPECTEPPPSDINNDCIVNISDLAVLAADWLDCGLVPQEACGE